MNKNRWLSVTLLVSMAINLLFLGALAGRYLNGPPPRSMPQSLGWLIQDMAPSEQAALRPQIAEHFRSVRPLRSSMRDAQREFIDILMEEPLDDAALKNSLAELRNSSVKYQSEMHNQMVEIVKQMDPPNRRKAIQLLYRESGPGGRRGRPAGRHQEKNSDRRGFPERSNADPDISADQLDEAVEEPQPK